MLKVRWLLVICLLVAGFQATAALAQLTVLGRVVDEQGRPVQNATINITDVDEKAEHKIRFVQKQAGGKSWFEVVPAQTITDKNGMFKVVMDRADIGNGTRGRIGLQYVPQTLNAKGSLLQNSQGITIIINIDPTVSIVDFREIIGDIVLHKSER